MLRASVAGLALILVGGGGGAQADCDHFKWSVAHELALFKDAPEPVEAGASAKLDRAYAVTLKPTDAAGFALPPERAAKPGTFGGIVKLDNVDPAGLYEVTISEEAWVDVIQAGARVKSDNFSGQKDCPGIRKSVRFNLTAGPAIVQISNAAGEAINLAVAPTPGG